MGLILGPTMINLFGLEPFARGHLEETILYLAEAGVIFLMFMAGLKIDLKDLSRVGGPAVLTGAMGVAVPLILGLLVTFGFGYPIMSAFFIGLILTATSVSISAQTLLELSLLRTRDGLTLLAAAVADDVLVILLLSGTVALTVPEAASGPADVIIIALRMALYVTTTALIGALVLPRLVLINQ